MFYATGQALPPDRDEAVKWFRLAAERGYPEALKALEALEDGKPLDVPEGR